MKKILVIAIQLVLCLQVWATNPDEPTFNNCDWTTLDLNENLSLCEKVRSNLATGFWTKRSESGTPETFIQFDEKGNVDWVTSSRETGVTHEIGRWCLKFSNRMPILILKNTTTATEMHFELERTCNGVLLTNQMTSTTMTLEHTLKQSSAAIKTAKIGLAGNWSNATYPFDISKKKNSAGTRRAMSGAFLKISFQSDGTYVKKYGNDKSRMLKKGEWEISRDGRFLFMKDENGVSVAKIQHLDLDEMVLEWQLENPQNTDFSTTQKSFAFIR